MVLNLTVQFPGGDTKEVFLDRNETFETPNGRGVCHSVLNDPAVE